VQVLRKLFERLQKFQLRLNPAKCLFEVKIGKMLGFTVSSQGIEIDPNKVKAIQLTVNCRCLKRRMKQKVFLGVWITYPSSLWIVSQYSNYLERKIQGYGIVIAKKILTRSKGIYKTTSDSILSANETSDSIINNDKNKYEMHVGLTWSIWVEITSHLLPKQKV
jgi:hypothetical protein